MADARRRHPQDRGGEWFVDTTCIACDVARELAPGLIDEDARGLSYFMREPRGTDEELMAWRALLACPTASIGAPRGAKPPPHAFPFEVAPGALLLGNNARHSFGANSYLVPRPDGNLMIDAPRWAPALAERIEALGGIEHILLTHRDDVADFDKYAARFDAHTWIHEADHDAAPNATNPFHEDTTIAPGVRAITTPGHTEGSAMFLIDDRLLFTGDSLEWSRTTHDLAAFEAYTWHSWPEQKRSLARLADIARFEWILPGHGGRGHATPDNMNARLRALVARM